MPLVSQHLRSVVPGLRSCPLVPAEICRVQSPGKWSFKRRGGLLLKLSLFPSLPPAPAAGWHRSSACQASASQALAGGQAGLWASCCCTHLLHRSPFYPCVLALNPLISTSLDLPFCSKMCSEATHQCRWERRTPWDAARVMMSPGAALAAALESEACAAWLQGHWGVVTASLLKVVTLQKLFQHLSF